MPGSDSVPVVWAGRQAGLNDWRDVVRQRRSAGLPERGRTILGEAGAGKSTLVRRIAAQAAREGDWVTPQVRIPLGADPLKIVAAALLDLADQASFAGAAGRKALDAVRRVREVSVGGVGLSIDRREGPEPFMALTELLVEVGRAARARGVVALVHVDEVQNITDDAALSQLLVCLGDALAFETTEPGPGGNPLTSVLPLAVYLTGLPHFADKAGAGQGATFARRFGTTLLEPISDDDLRLALHPFVVPGWQVVGDDGRPGTVHLTPDAVDEVVRLCCGEPFLFQLAGERAWYAGSSPLVTADDVRAGWAQAHHEAAAHVERIVARLPERERQMLDTMAALDPADRTATTIARAMGFTSASQVAPTAQRLDTVRGIINRGGLYTFRHRAVEAHLTSGWPRV